MENLTNWLKNRSRQIIVIKSAELSVQIHTTEYANDIHNNDILQYTNELNITEKTNFTDLLQTEFLFQVSRLRWTEILKPYSRLSPA